MDSYIIICIFYLFFLDLLSLFFLSRLPLQPHSKPLWRFRLLVLFYFCSSSCSCLSQERRTEIEPRLHRAALRAEDKKAKLTDRRLRSHKKIIYFFVQHHFVMLKKKSYAFFFRKKFLRNFFQKKSF
jgi:hypothetical protein